MVFFGLTVHKTHSLVSLRLVLLGIVFAVGLSILAPAVASESSSKEIAPGNDGGGCRRTGSPNPFGLRGAGDSGGDRQRRRLDLRKGVTACGFSVSHTRSTPKHCSQ